MYIFNCLLLLDCFLSLIFSPTSFTGLKCRFNLFFSLFLTFFFLLCVCVRAHAALGRDSLAVFGHSFETLFFVSIFERCKNSPVVFQIDVGPKGKGIKEA